MISDDVSPAVRRLTYRILKSIIEKTNNNLRIPIRFGQLYMEACNRDTDNRYESSNLEMRQHIRDILLRNDYIFVNPDDVEEIFITKKAIDQYESIPKDNL
jgi:hypothetical protein